MKFRFTPLVLKTFICSLMMLWSLAAIGQITVSGSVTDSETGEPMIGVNISVQGKMTGTITDLDGNFELKTSSAPPFVLVFSYTGYTTVEETINSDQGDLRISLEPASVLTSEVVISASRVEERILESPVTIEKMDPIAIRQTAAADFYDGISNLKGVQTTQGSLTLTSINTRGFGAIANERFVQLIDGMDNAAPLLNFPTGNLVGISELDALSVELVPGAASALYGPNAFNGILLMNSKNPFDYQGLSVQTKLGVTNSDASGETEPYYLLSARYAKAFNDKFAFKLNVSYLGATDWIANDYTTGRITAGNPNPSGVGAPNFDGLNLYGDETRIQVPMSVLATPLSAALAPQVAAGLMIPVEQAEALLLQTIPNMPSLDVTRTGLQEQNLLENNDATSIKFDAALHYRLTEDLEASVSYRFGSGASVYQGGERYVLRDFSQQFIKAELTSSNFFARAYTTITDDGDSYNLSALGAFANERFSPTQNEWLPTYAGNYAGALFPIYAQGQTPTSEQIAQANAAGRAAADARIPAPGTAEFNSLIDAVRNDLFQGNPPGAGFVDNSRLYHAEFGYNLKEIVDVVDILVGGNFRQYDLFSEGTIFNENPDGEGEPERIMINEFGFYAQLSKALANERLKLTGSLRFDKNENFDGQVSPRLSAVYSAGAKRQHNFRASFQTGFRNPSTQNQFIFFPLANGILIGSTESNAARYGIHNGGAYTQNSYNAFIGSVLAGAPNPGLLEEDNFGYVTPEQIQVFEVGYKSLINNKLLIDLNYYYSIYNDFIAQRTVIAKEGTTHQGEYLPGVMDILEGTASSATAWRPYVNTEEEVTSSGIGLGLTYRLPKGYNLYGNYAYSTFDVENPSPGFEAGFNMPENKFLIGIGNRKAFKNFGFDLNYRWQDEFEWQNSFAFATIPAYGVLNAQLNYTIDSVKTVVKVGGTNLFGDDYRTNAGGPFIGRMYYISLTFDQFMN